MTTLALLLFLVQDATDLKKALAREILGPQTSLEEIQDFIEPRVPAVPEVKSAAEWKALEADLRRRVVEGLFYRGEAKKWASAPTRIEWVGDIPGGPGYRIRKLRYEAVPGLWIPALLYVPEKLSGKVPVHMAVNGHDGAGKAADYKQMRCINLAKRGVISLNVEWYGMGQLRGPGYGHYLMNQLDLCGTAGLAPFYLSMKRGLDVLLSLENADPARVAVSGLSGGSWQTITISSLDTRVTLTNPVAGYSSFKTRVRHLKDLGDSEQTPSDLATVADYAHLTAMMAPRATLLTFNARDNCCFESNYALQPLMDAAQPVFRLLGAETSLRAHVNHDPGTHNFGPDNRQALYRMIGDHFFPDDPAYDAREIPSENEIRKGDELAVELPKDNATFTTLARALAADLPRPGGTIAMLRELLRGKEYKATAGTAFREGNVAGWKLMMGKDFTVPATEISPAAPTSTVLLFSENGRATLAAEVQKQLDAGRRVIAIDPFFYGESKIASHGFLFAMTAAAVGERPLGLQASQIAAAARWAEAEFKQGPVTVVAVGPRASVVALAAAALETKSIGGLQLHQPMESLKELIEKGVGVDRMPELFCFGLLRDFDMKELIALAAPRPVAIIKQDAPFKPDEAPAKMTVPEGFKVTLFAGEPDVVQPMGFTFDDRGRLWVVECLSYPKWLPPGQEGRDRIVIFEDTDGDGKFDTKKVFADKLANVSGIAWGHGGVWLTAVPYFLFLPDRNRDDVPDGPAEILLDGWDLKAKHNVFNKPMWGPDGWLYACNGILSNSRVGRPGTPDADRVAMNCGVWRYHPVTRKFEIVCNGTTNPWGLDWDEYGRGFITNCVIKHVFQVIPGAHYDRMFGEDKSAPAVYGLMPSPADHIHWAGGNWTDSRAGEKHSQAGGGHAHVGAMIYLGDNWPDAYRGHLFTLNLHGHRMSHDVVEPKGSGVVVTHAKDFLLGNDTWFRGLDCQYGPDGGVYVTDWTDTGECHNYDKVDLTNGRIYKITYGNAKPVKVDLAKSSDADLMARLDSSSKNVWFARQAQRLLHERAAAGKLDPLGTGGILTPARNESDPVGDLRRMWTAHAAGLLQEPDRMRAMSDPFEHRRAWAVTLELEDGKASGDMLQKLAELARGDKSPVVRLALASGLQRLPVADRLPIAEALLAHEEDSTDANLPLMYWYAIEPIVSADKEKAVSLLAKAKIPLVRQFITRRIASLAK